MGNGMPDRNNSANEHAWVEERLSAYIDDQLNSLERAQLERHLRDCARCQTSLASLRWTVSLVKHAPAPALPRQFTLPLPAPTPSTRRAPAFGFGLARLATVVATLLLFAVVTVDLLTRLGGGFAASAPNAMRAVEPTSIALAPSSADETKHATPTASPERLLAVPPAPIAPTLTSPEVTGRGGAASETPSPKFATQNAVGTRTVQRAQPVNPRASATPTATIAANAPSAALEVTATQTPEAHATETPPPTVIAQARVPPTAAPLPPRPEVATPPLTVSPLRVAEIGLFFFTVFFGALTLMLWRRK